MGITVFKEKKIGNSFVPEPLADDTSVATFLTDKLPKALEKADQLRASGDLAGYDRIVSQAHRYIELNRDELAKVSALANNDNIPPLLRTIGARAKDAVSSGLPGGRRVSSQEDYFGDAAVSRVAALNNTDRDLAIRIIRGEQGDLSTYETSILERSKEFANVAGGTFSDFKNTHGQEFAKHGMRWQKYIARHPNSAGGKSISTGYGTTLAEGVSYGYIMGHDRGSRDKATASILGIAEWLGEGLGPDMNQYLDSINEGIELAFNNTPRRDEESGKVIPGTGYGVHADDGGAQRVFSVLKSSLRKNTHPNTVKQIVAKSLSSYHEMVASGRVSSNDYIPVLAEVAVAGAIGPTHGRVQLSPRAEAYKEVSEAAPAAISRLTSEVGSGSFSRDTRSSIAGQIVMGLSDFTLSNDNWRGDYEGTAEDLIYAYATLNEDEIEDQVPLEVDKRLTEFRNQAIDSAQGYIISSVGVSPKTAKTIVMTQLSGISSLDQIGNAEKMKAVSDKADLFGFADLDLSGDALMPENITPATIASTAQMYIGEGDAGPLGDPEDERVKPLIDELKVIKDEMETYETPVTQHQHMIRDVFTPKLQERLNNNERLKELSIHYTRSTDDGTKKRYLQERNDIIEKEAREILLETPEGEERESLYEALRMANVAYKQHFYAPDDRVWPVTVTPIREETTVTGTGITKLLEPPPQGVPVTKDNSGEFNFSRLGELYKEAGGPLDAFRSKKMYAPEDSKIREAAEKISKLAKKSKSEAEKNNFRTMAAMQRSGVTPSEMKTAVRELNKRIGDTTTKALKSKVVNLLDKMADRADEEGRAAAWSMFNQKSQQASNTESRADLILLLMEAENSALNLEAGKKAYEAGVIATAKEKAKAAANPPTGAPAPAPADNEE